MVGENDKFLECLICSDPVKLIDPDKVSRDDDGHIQGSYNVAGGHVRIDFGFGSQYDIIGEEFYQAHICDSCFGKIKARTRLVVSVPRNPVFAILENTKQNKVVK